MDQKLRHYRYYVISGASKADFTKDATSYDKISNDERRPLYSILPTVKHSCYRLPRKTFQLPFIVNTQTPAELSINYNLAI